MKAKELAEILLKYPEKEVIIDPDEIKKDSLGLPVEQVIERAYPAFRWSIPVDGQPIILIAKNHPIYRK